jgi:hypothetical protein
MNSRARSIFLTLLLALYGASPAMGGEPLAVFTPEKIDNSYKHLGIDKEDAYRLDSRTVVVTGVGTEGDHANDYGARFFVVQGNELVFRSKGMMDSWYLDLTFFQPATITHKYLVMAETGDEGGSYGFSVYELMNSQVKHLGYISAGILDEETILSAVPHLEIAEYSGKYVFTFTKDVAVQDAKTATYNTISKESLQYIYAGSDLILKIAD